MIVEPQLWEIIPHAGESRLHWEESHHEKGKADDLDHHSRDCVEC